MSRHGQGSTWPPSWPDVTDQAVMDAMARVPRHLFVPPAHRHDAYLDIPLPIGHDQTISQPYIVALMTQACQIGPHSRVLEIGTGSGYQAAVLATITPYVWSVETRPELAPMAAKRLRDLGYDVTVKQGDGCMGWPEHAPYDAILVTAAAESVPPALVVQLADHGRLVMPVGKHSWDQRLWRIEKRQGVLSRQVLAEVRFVPLVVGAANEGSGGDELEDVRRQLEQLFR